MSMSTISSRALARTNCVAAKPFGCLRLRFGRRGFLPASGATLVAPALGDSLQRQQQRSIFSWLFSKKAPAPKPKASSNVYPVPRDVLVYHAGRRQVYVGCIKLATLWPFISTLFYVQPHINDYPQLAQYPIVQEQPYLAPVLVTAISAVPIWLFWFAAPYATHMYVRIPSRARVSKEAAAEFIRSMGPETHVKIATMWGLGRPKLKEMPVGELRWVNKRLGCANIEWKEKLDSGVVKIRHFYVDEGGGSKWGEKESLEAVLESIKRRTAEKEQQDKKDVLKLLKDADKERFGGR